MQSHYSQYLSGLAGVLVANDSDRDWETWGKQNPYFGVLADQKFLNENLNEDSLQQFFLSGKSHVDHVYKVIRAKIRPDFAPVRVLDYGSGVGRILIPLAQRAEVAYGVDISSSMLQIASDNCRKSGASATFINACDLDQIPVSSFDLVHSSLVFQHIPVSRGEDIFRKLISILASGGVGAIHFNYADTRRSAIKAASFARKKSALVHRMLNLLQERSFSAPMMQMNNYSINRLFNILMEERCFNSYVEFSEHGEHRGATLYFEKP
jgi:SAM-dependent methyltransferase